MSTVATVNDYDLLKKPVNTLAIVPVSRKITVLGRKMYNVMLDMSQEIGIDNDVYRAPLTEIVSGIDYGSNDLELIKKHLRSMYFVRHRLGGLLLRQLARGLIDCAPPPSSFQKSLLLRGLPD